MQSSTNVRTLKQVGLGLRNLGPSVENWESVFDYAMRSLITIANNGEYEITTVTLKTCIVSYTDCDCKRSVEVMAETLNEPRSWVSKP
jgi:hypothetical protein